jgi:hypothetical protein
MRRARIVLTAVFGLLALNAWAQVVFVPLGRSDDPPLLTAWQALVGAAGAAAAWGSWAAARWAPAAAVAYGVTTAGMLVALGPMLGLEAAARGGLWAGAAVLLALGIGSAWYLRRIIRAVHAGAPVESRRAAG